MLLYCSTRLARTSWVAGSTTGAPAVKPAKGLPTPVAVPPTAPIVDEAASLVVVMLIAPVPSTVACRLLAASLAFRSLRDLTVPPVPLPVAPMVRGRVGSRRGPGFE